MFRNFQPNVYNWHVLISNLTWFFFFLSYQICNFVIGLYFLSVMNKFGISSVYLGFSAVCVLAVLYIASNVVETKGRSLEEIERALSSPAWETSRNEECCHYSNAAQWTVLSLYSYYLGQLVYCNQILLVCKYGNNNLWVFCKAFVFNTIFYSFFW
jgi:hypothetical protein